jgi:stage IV sporulation protein B
VFLKKFKNIILASLISFIIIPNSVSAYSSYVIPGGENIGIQIKSKGIMIVGLYKVQNGYPGRDAGLKIGDKILSVNNVTTNSINEMVNIINENINKTSLLIKYLRNNKVYETTLDLIKDQNNIYKTGLYVKDTINGVGTLTFIDPNSKLFGALGHEIIERSSGQKIEVKDGKIFKSEVFNIEKSTRGNPGEKTARFYYDVKYGNIFENTARGIFGNYHSIPNKQTMKVAEPNQVKTGSATIYTVLSGEKVEEFSINIISIDYNHKQKNILFEINDKRLLDITGGVVQGMSGSPIIQDNMIIGAVTHVVVEDATKGYGIFIKWMLEEAEN